MDKKINLIIIAFLLGGLSTVLPTLIKICVFVGVGLVLFIKYDEFDYERRVGGNNND